MPKYLLPCACGNQLPVGPTDAGLMVTCTCGARVKVPNTRGIRALPRLSTGVPEDDAESAARWGLRYQLLTAGLVCLLFGAILTGYFTYTRPQDPTEWMAEYEIQRMPINMLIAVWGQYQDGFQPLDTKLVEEYEVRRDENTRLTWVSYAVMTGGGVLLVLALFSSGKRR